MSRNYTDDENRRWKAGFIKGAMAMLAIALGIACIPFSSFSCPEEKTSLDLSEWQCEKNETTVKFANGCAHFIRNDQVVGIYQFRNIDDQIWAARVETSWGREQNKIIFSKIGDELHVKHEDEDAGTAYPMLISGIYYKPEIATPDIVLPIDLDEAPHHTVDINVQPGQTVHLRLDGRRK